MTTAAGFDGFPAAAPSFLRTLADNNDRNWFRAHRGNYEELVLSPMRRLLVALAPSLSAIDPGLDSDPRGGAISRIHRDVRFSHDKAPFRINQWLSFKRPGRDWQNRPAFFLEFGPSGYRYGMGYYAAAPATMASVRNTIDTRTLLFLDVMHRATKAGFAVEGDAYRRPRLPPNRPEAVLEWHRRKTVYLARNRPLEPVFFSPALAGDLCNRFAALAPLYRFLTGITPPGSPPSPAPPD